MTAASLQLQGELSALLGALAFAAERHADQAQSKSPGPFINHPIEVAEILARVGKVSALAPLQAALLHDVLEKTATSPDELEQRFGAEVRALVQELTDDMTLPKEERKKRQLETAPTLSAHAKRLRIADKICNVSKLSRTQPADWSLERKRSYFTWAEQIVAGCRDASPELDDYFGRIVRARRAALD